MDVVDLHRHFVCVIFEFSVDILLVFGDTLCVVLRQMPACDTGPQEAEIVFVLYVHNAFSFGDGIREGAIATTTHWVDSTDVKVPVCGI